MSSWIQNILGPNQPQAPVPNQDRMLSLLKGDPGNKTEMWGPQAPSIQAIMPTGTPGGINPSSQGWWKVADQFRNSEQNIFKWYRTMNQQLVDTHAAEVRSLHPNIEPNDPQLVETANRLWEQKYKPLSDGLVSRFQSMRARLKDAADLKLLRKGATTSDVVGRRDYNLFDPAITVSPKKITNTGEFEFGETPGGKYTGGYETVRKPPMTRWYNKWAKGQQ